MEGAERSTAVKGVKRLYANGFATRNRVFYCYWVKSNPAIPCVEWFLI